MSLRLFTNRIKHTFVNVFKLKDYMVADALPYGLKFKFQTRSEVGRQIYYKYGVYGEDYICQYLLNTVGIAENDLIVDIGANIGWYSIVLSTREKPRIVAFEPNKENFSLFCENLEMNGIKNVKPFNLGVSDKNETLTLNLYKKHNPGGHSFIPFDKSYGTEETKVVALDDFLEKNGYGEGPIKLIKIDIEGYEYTALKLAVKTLSRTQFLLAEFTPEFLKKNGQNPQDFLDHLKDMGFRIQGIDEKGPYEPDFDKLIREDTGINLFCSKEALS